MNVAGPSAMSLSNQQQTLGGLPSPTLDYESSYCQGCRNPIDADPVHGGVVVQFASSLWHTACFRCAKCGDQLSAQSTLVLLNDGSPVCSKCSYVCNVCKLEINDEAIMTGEDSYHASCFTCRTCHKRIEELVFAKTSAGIYCMDCHNDRVARSRRRAEHKQSKNRTRRAKEGDQSREVKSPARPGSGGAQAQQQRPPLAAHPSNDGSQVDQSYSSLAPPSRSNSKQAIPQDIDASFVSDFGELSDAMVQQVQPNDGGLPTGSTIILSPDDGEIGFGGLQDEPESQHDLSSQQPVRQATLPILPAPSPDEQKRGKSYADDTRPLQNFFTNKGPRTSDSSMASMSMPGGLGIPGRATTKAERRRSMNPPPRPSTDSAEDSRGRSVSSGSDTSAYYSPGVGTPGSGPSPPHSTQLEVAQNSRSRSRSPSVSNQQPPSIQIPQDGSSSKPETPVSSFPPRGQSLRNPRADSKDNIAIATPSNPTSRPKMPPPEPSFSFEPASDDEGDSSMDAPAPPPKDDSPSRPSTPNPPPSLSLVATPSTPPASKAPLQPGTSNDEEMTPVQSRRTAGSLPIELAAPALPPIRLSLHTTDFADLLKSVADGSPRVPMPRESLLRISSPTAGTSPRNHDTSRDIPSEADEDEPPPSPSVLARERISASQTLPSSLVPVPDHGYSSGEGEDARSPQSVTPTQAGQSHSSPETAASSPNVPTASLSTPAGFTSSAPSVAAAVLRNRSGSEGQQRRPAVVAAQSRPSGELPRENGAGDKLLLSPGMYASSAPGGGISDAPSAFNGLNGSRPSPRRTDSAVEMAGRRLREALSDVQSRGATSLKIDAQFAEVLLRAIDSSKEVHSGLKADLDIVKRESYQYKSGFSVAQEEYSKEVAHRKDLEAEITRLRVQLAGQAARLVAVTAQDRTQAALDKLAVEATGRLQGLEREVARLQVEKDMMLAEIEEINLIKKSGNNNDAIANVARALSSRLDYTKTQYRRELEPLEEKRERLVHDLAELREARSIFVEETTALNTRNEQLAELNAQIALQIQAAAADGVSMGLPGLGQLAQGQGLISQDSPNMSAQSDTFKSSAPASARSRRPENRGRYSPSITSSATINTLVGTGSNEGSDEFGAKIQKATKADAPEPVQQKKFKWFGPGGGKHSAGPTVPDKPAPITVDKPNGRQVESMHNHNFTSANMLRIGRCDQCGDKLWGMALRCTNCNFSCHSRCGVVVKGKCRPSDQHHHHEESMGEILPIPPSMFGRDLIEQVHADARGSGRTIPIIVEKCLEAVEASGLDYEGIYRKTGGAGESKSITQMFERGNYASIDLLDGESFHDISSVTSVLKNYFRGLPNPLFTYDHHESFVQAHMIRDTEDRVAALRSLCQSLPLEHYCTLRKLMLHLSLVEHHKDVNLMNARNLGVVFGPTLMRSRDPGQEFADMAGKAQTIEWLVNHAATIFKEAEPRPSF